jgi:hypothetical protein
MIIKKLITYIGIVTLIWTVFEIPRNFFEIPIYGKYAGNTAHTITNSKIWFDEGPQNISFASILSFPSVQYKNVDKNSHTRHIGGLTFPAEINGYLREIYISYPTGYIFPLYLDSIIFNERPGENGVFRVNDLAFFFLIISLYILLLTVNPGSTYLSAFILFISLISVAVIYFLQVFLSYNSLGAIYYAVYLALYFRGLKKLSLLTLLIGLLTDYIFFFIVLTHFTLLLFRNKKFNSYIIYLLLFSFIAFIIYISQLYKLNVLDNLWWKFKFRIGMEDTLANDEMIKDLSKLNFFYFGYYYILNLSKVISPIILLTPIFLMSVRKRITSEECDLLVLSFIPPFLYTLILQSSSIHEYETLKFIPFFLIITGLFVKYSHINKKAFLTFFLIVNSLISLYCLPKYYYISKDYAYNHNLNLIIKNNTNPNDVIFKFESPTSIWNGKLTFTVAPYLWWVDNAYRERNINRVTSFDDLLNTLCRFNIDFSRVILLSTEKEDIEITSSIYKYVSIYNDTKNIKIFEIHIDKNTLYSDTCKKLSYN